MHADHGSLAGLEAHLQTLRLSGDERLHIVSQVRETLRRGDRADPAAGLAEAARYLLTVPGQLADLLGAKLIRNPNLDILLTLYVAAHDRRPFGASALGRAIHAGPTKVLRHVETLESEGLVRRRDDEQDARRTWIELTPKATEAISRLLLALQDSN